MIIKDFIDEFFPEAPYPSHIIFRLISICWVFFIAIIAFPSLFIYLAVNPQQFYPWQLITAVFCSLSPHALFYSSATFWMFGRHVEKELGDKNFIRFFLVSSLSANFFWLLFTWCFREGTIDFAYGLVGINYACIYGYAFFNPNKCIRMNGIVTLRARHFALLYGLLALVHTLDRKFGGPDDLLALCGMLVAAAYLDVTYNGPLTRRLRNATNS